MLILKNGLYLSAQGEFVEGNIFIEDGIIKSITKKINFLCHYQSRGGQIEILDLKGKYLIPGLVDIHTHGAIGYDISIATPSQISKLSRYYSHRGITSFLPTIITSSSQDRMNALRNIRQAHEMGSSGASIEGVHLEGPFINSKRRGTHNPNWITSPKFSDFDQYKDILGDLKIHITVAPEIENCLEFIRYVAHRGGSIGIGHTDGDYQMTLQAIEAGASIFTHLFNAMRAPHHREPGVVGAALASQAMVEIIADGIHIHPAMVKTTIKAKGYDKVVLVTDSMHAAGLGEGKYDFGGFEVEIKGGVAKKQDGTIAGSLINLMDGVRNVVGFAEIPLEEAVAMATINPARVLGLDHIIGSIEVGKRADLVAIDDDIKVHRVFCRGKRVR